MEEQVWFSFETLLLTMTKENVIHLNEALHDSLKRRNSTLDEYILKFMELYHKLAAMTKLMDDITKVFHQLCKIGYVLSNPYLLSS